MDLQDGDRERFSTYIGTLASVIGRRDRAGHLRDYCTGLLMPAERKSVEPIAAMVAPASTAARHQSLLHFVGNAGWSDEAVLAKVRECALPSLEKQAPITGWIVDDTGFPKKGTESVGVARQYCGQRGKQDNCQVAVSLSLANAHGSLPVAFRLYMPEQWIADTERREKTGVPDAVVFKTKPEIALEQIRAAYAAGLPRGTVLADVAYGASTKFRKGISALGLRYAAAVGAGTAVWTTAVAPSPEVRGRGRRRAARPDRHESYVRLSVEDLARALPSDEWQTIEWREGVAGALQSRFARLRVRIAQGQRAKPGRSPEEWLLIEWPEGEAEPSGFWLSTLDEDIAFTDFVDRVKLRWRIERDYLELKQEVGLGQYEVRGWRGFHHHATLCIAAYGFLVRERAAFPPSAARSRAVLAGFAVPDGYRPRGAAGPH